jgi:hypothetical protein
MRSGTTGKFRLVSTVTVGTSMIPFKLWPVEIRRFPVCTSCAFKFLAAKSALSVRTGSGSGTATEKAWRRFRRADGGPGVCTGRAGVVGACGLAE